MYFSLSLCVSIFSLPPHLGHILKRGLLSLGSVDSPIVDFVEYLNSLADFYTTSSCSGRICIFLLGQSHKAIEEEEEEEAGEENLPSSSSSTSPPSSSSSSSSSSSIGSFCDSKKEKGGGVGGWLLSRHGLVTYDEVKSALNGFTGSGRNVTALFKVVIFSSSFYFSEALSFISPLLSHHLSPSLSPSPSPSLSPSPSPSSSPSPSPSPSSTNHLSYTWSASPLRLPRRCSKSQYDADSGIVLSAKLYDD